MNETTPLAFASWLGRGTKTPILISYRILLLTLYSVLSDRQHHKKLKGKLNLSVKEYINHIEQRKKSVISPDHKHLDIDNLDLNQVHIFKFMFHSPFTANRKWK